MANQQMLCFATDCQELIKSFLSFNSIKFECFVAAWQKMNFHYIFYGNERHPEINQLVENGLLVVKHEFIKASLQNVRIGFFYLLYTLYFKQPVDEFCKLRFVLSEWEELHNFYESFDTNDRETDQIRLIFWKLIQADAFRFVQSDHEYGFEYFMQNRNLNKTVKSQSFDCRSNNVAVKVEKELDRFQNEKTGILSAIGLLQGCYNEMKEHLDKTSPATGILPNTTVLEEIMSGIKQIEKNFQIQSVKSNNTDVTPLNVTTTTKTVAETTTEANCSTSSAISTTKMAKTPELPNRKLKKSRKTKAKLEIGQRRNKLKFKGFSVQNRHKPEKSQSSSNSDSDSDEENNKKLKSMMRITERSKKDMIPTWTLSEYDNHFLITPPNWIQKNRPSAIERLRRTVNRVLEDSEELDEELEPSKNACNTKLSSSAEVIGVSTATATDISIDDRKKKKSSSTVTSSLPAI